MPALPALVASHAGAWIADADGTVRSVTRAEAIRAAADTPHLLLAAPVTASRLGYGELAGLDLLELFAFVHPARFMVPTASGLAQALDLAPPESEAAQARLLQAAAARLLAAMERPDWPERAGAWGTAQGLARLRWAWAALVRERLQPPPRGERELFQALPRWEETPPRPAPRSLAVDAEETVARLDALTGRGGETRAGQRDLARAAARAFAPRDAAGRPQLVLAQAGTGIGKTLGYLAPAQLWAERADGAVWLSTYTKALQRQLRAEAARLFADGGDARQVVVRKGRENYLCLLNLEDAVQGGFGGRAGMFAQLAARWARYSRDGDMVGGDLPGWLASLFPRTALGALTDRRGECIYAGCPHFRSCFIERAARASEHAQLVIANHALVMVTATRARGDGAALARIVFDEGHHLFDAADACFSLHLTGGETIELRRWLVGPERTTRGRRRGLPARLADVLNYDAETARALDDCLAAARLLPADNWLARVAAGEAQGPIEALLVQVRQLVQARADDRDAGYSLEAELAEPPPALIEAAAAAAQALEQLAAPMLRLAARLAALLDDPPDWLDPQGRARLDSSRAGLELRAQLLSGWTALLARVGGPADPAFVDWLAVDRSDGRELDLGLHRHWLDPMAPFARTILEPAHGVLATSATLLPRGADEVEAWSEAQARTGMAHVDAPVQRFSAESPFDYGANARVIIVNDVKRGDVAGLSTAYAQLIEAAGGGALGLFTAIARLRIVYARIADRLARAGLPLYAQHVDPIDTGTLVDMFRADPNASLLGTDAVRDGVDVPGGSLRLVVMEGVPWPRPTVLHAARRAAYGGRALDDRIAVDRLTQAFGRLIRRADDRGLFVLLGAAVPSRLLAAFPPGVTIERLPLATATDTVRDWLAASPSPAASSA